MSYSGMKKIEDNTNFTLFNMAIAHYCDIGYRNAIKITDEEIESLEENGMMTKEFVQDLVRTTREIARECGNNPIEIIQYCQAEKFYDTKNYKKGV